ncbi:MAG: hypothetical protein JSU65_09560 [Candidatus Zixiibacteriota bacterium]|nr:MAG: hypothetical protein JSU65_09560 [candidate division Zixibacteria bacterium]
MEICFSYDPDVVVNVREHKLRLFYRVGDPDVWEDITLLPVDKAGNILCGRTDSLSPFFIGVCCIGTTGNVDGDPDDIVDIGDLTLLIDFLFISKEKLLCMEEANIDGTDPMDIGDLTALIDYLFISFTPPAECL